MSFTAAIAVAALTISVFTRYLVLDAIGQVRTLRCRVEALEAHQDGLRVMFARSAERRERSNGGAS